MKSEKYYKETFDEVHVPLALLGKVRDMKMEKKEIEKKSKLRYALSAVAAFVFCMVVSNGICYAATGETWISKAIVYINGEPVEKDITWHMEGDTVVGEMEVDVSEDGTARVDYFEVRDDDISGIDDVQDMQIELTDNESALMNAEVISEGDRVFLCVNDEKIDITEDFADGSCTGTFEMDGKTLNYEVTGTIEEYSISIMCAL